MTIEELFGKSYTLNAKEVCKFLRKPIKWYTYAERVPRVGELIFLPSLKWAGKNSQVISQGDHNYIKNDYSDYAKKISKYYVICQTKLY